ncbi:exported hypothetical protein [Desulfamplus magnetovallimortis]|uniref:CHAT domain-containing protein n=1 Tax=Desulfamplus magnetovallimortis TaxID=1246637 RepID=A0A1W1HHF7_9BACT|nr:CHAT domain-containing protein [Desulfamplus magnetovallimortis]SLM31863.1 exported hypothetical protein [Desulfamplus magnetovallimortis]
MSNTIKTYAQRLVLVLLLVFFNLVCQAEAAIHKASATPETPEVAQLFHLTNQLESATGIQEIKLLLSRGEIFRTLGFYEKAEVDFKDALSKSQILKHPRLEIISMQCLGYIHFLGQDIKSAETMLRSALEKSENLQPFSSDIAASCASRLGNVLAGRNNMAEALNLYKRALTLIEETGLNQDHAHKAAIHRNIAHVLPPSDNAAAFEHLSQAIVSVDEIKSPREQAKILLEIATEAGFREPGTTGDAFRYHTLKRAQSLAENLDSPQDPRLVSLAHGSMGELYESRNRIEDALILTERAVTSAGAIQDHDLLMQWEWQMGRLFKSKGERNQAIAAFQRALFHVDAIRQDMAIANEEGCSSFRTTLFPIYTGLADLLLEASGHEKDSFVQQQLLREAQQAVEKSKQSELRDYFRDPCIDAMAQEITTLSSGTAVIYPVIFPDRLEILADIGGTLYRKTALVRGEIVEDTVSQLSLNLRNNLFYEQLGKEVYGWLIAPLKSLLEENRVDTLVFVPDGVFRMLPMAALWDGTGFLAQHYAVVTEPGLMLLDPKPLPRGQMRGLMAGMSEPGPVIMELPGILWQTLCQTTLDSRDRGVRGFSVKSAQLKRDNAELETPSSSTDSSSSQFSQISDSSQTAEAEAQHVKELLRLPGVAGEMENISANLKGQLLMNDEFLLNRFASELEHKDYGVIHIASHGFFGGNPDENFIMTYDKILSMNLLEEFIRPREFAQKPVELITLSACQTAEGDDRSPLGLSGVALKSGARSVLGSLWPVSDIATQKLLSTFYERLAKEEITKAKALQEAQIALINQKQYNAPFYWAAFILLGNWL